MNRSMRVNWQGGLQSAVAIGGAACVGSAVVGRSEEKKGYSIRQITMVLAISGLVFFAGAAQGPSHAAQPPTPGQQPALNQPDRPVLVGNVFPHMTVMASGVGSESETGIGAMIPWANRLWAIGYVAHIRGSGIGLYEIGPDLSFRKHAESITGTFANRLVHWESKQVFNGNIRQQPYPHIGDIVAELEPKKRAHAGAGNTADLYEDDHRLALVRSQPGLTLLTEQRVNAVEAQGGVLRSVVAQHTRTARRLRIEGRWFADCTGDGTIGFLAGAVHEVTRTQHMGASNLWNVADTGAAEPFPKCLCQDNDSIDKTIVEMGKPVPFPCCPWAVDLKDKSFPGRQQAAAQWSKPGLQSLGIWFWESGFDRDPIEDVEWMRDLNLRAMYGAWDVLKNVDGKYPNHKLAWAAYIAGKRESRRLLGDVVLTVDDFRKNRVFPDGCFPCTWHIDLHTPAPTYGKGHAGEEFISQATTGKGYSYKGPYWVPYRCLYSRNIGNLFMAGRDISVTHEALGPVRVMRTCGMMGEVVGMAASLCRKHSCDPREVYKKHLMEFKELMKAGVPL